MPDATPRMTLYHSPQSRSTTARWMLEELGEPYEIKLVDLAAGAQREPSYLAINPMGKVPALVHDGTVLTEVAAICCYLADAYPQANLAPPIGDARRGPYLKWLFFGPSCAEPALIAKSMGGPQPPRGQAGWGDYDTVIGVLQQAVANGPYILGEQFTAADVVIGAGLRWGMLFKLLPELPEFVAYTQRLAERPALQRQTARDRELLSPPPA
jgi:glutathione S-transferase